MDSFKMNENQIWSGETPWRSWLQTWKKSRIPTKQTGQLQAAPPFYFIEDDEHREPLYGVCFKCGKQATGQETALASAADSMLSKLDQQDAGVALVPVSLHNSEQCLNRFQILIGWMKHLSKDGLLKELEMPDTPWLSAAEGILRLRELQCSSGYAV